MKNFFFACTHILKQYRYVFIGLLLFIMFVFQVTSAVQETQTVDEGVHLSAGYSYLLTGDFRMNMEHPPLAKVLSALPLALLGDSLNSPFSADSWESHNQWQFAKDLLYDNTYHADFLFLLGRLPIMLLSLVLGIYVYRFARELWGTLPGLLSLTLYAFSPTVIAHSRYVTTDLAVTAFSFITIYYFYKYLKTDKQRLLLLTGVFFGMAQATKFSALIMAAVIPLLYLIYLVITKQQWPIKQILRHGVITLGIIYILGGVVVWASYGFEVKKPVQNPDIAALVQQREQISARGDAVNQDELIQKAVSITDPDTFIGGGILHITKKVSLPCISYLNGIGKLFVHNYYGHTAYLLGHYSEMGWWYYFPLAFALKTPIPILLSVAVLIIAAVLHLYRGIVPSRHVSSMPRWRLWPWFLGLPPLIYFLFSMTSHINIGVRHLLVIFPFIFTLTGWIISHRLHGKQRIIRNTILCVLMSWYISTSLFIYPHYLAYFNELAGGPAHGPQYLVDSNIDWGQDIKHLKKFMLAHDISYVCMSYFGQTELDTYGIDYRYIPDQAHYQGIDRIDCVVAISVTSLLSKDGAYWWLRQFEPDARIGYSIYVYDFRKN